jgi:tetratricopeptide (TPR) repeat protein
MKKLLLILLCLPMIGFGQWVASDSLKYRSEIISSIWEFTDSDYIYEISFLEDGTLLYKYKFINSYENLPFVEAKRDVENKWEIRRYPGGGVGLRFYLNNFRYFKCNGGITISNHTHNNYSCLPEVSKLGGQIWVNAVLNKTKDSAGALAYYDGKVGKHVTNDGGRTYQGICNTAFPGKKKFSKLNSQIQNAKYYFDLADSRIKSKPNWADDMLTEDWLFQVENIKLCLELESDYWEAYIIRGNAYYELGKYRESLEDFEKGQKYTPKDFMWLFHLGIGNAKIHLGLNYCNEFKKACDLGYCDAYNDLCK